jgi:hypothetical protein
VGGVEPSCRYHLHHLALLKVAEVMNPIYRATHKELKVERRDVNAIELLGRNHLIASLVEDEVFAAIPIWDKGIDLIAYFEDPETNRSVSRPIQLKANENCRWGLHQKYRVPANLLMVYVWHVRQRNDVRIFAMTYDEAFAILEQRGHTETPSWRDRGGYTIPNIDDRLLNALAPFEMGAGTWKARLMKE